MIIMKLKSKSKDKIREKFNRIMIRIESTLLQVKLESQHILNMHFITLWNEKNKKHNQTIIETNFINSCFTNVKLNGIVYYF